MPRENTERAAQTEGGEKPRDFATNATSATKAALDALAKAEKDEGLYDRVTCPTCKGRKWVNAEPSSPPATAGGAREFADKYGYDLTRLAKISDGILNLMTAFGDYRFAHGERAGYASRNGEITELRREAVALIADIEGVWTALEMSGYEGEESPARFVRQEREARERAEKALREFGQHHCNCNQAEVNSGCTCGFERVLASLKSSEGAK